MKKHYSLVLTFILLIIVSSLSAQEVFWAAANPYQGSAELVTALSESGAVVAKPIPSNNNDLWGNVRPQIYRGTDGNIYGLTQNSEGSIFYKITDDGVHPVYQFEYGTFGPMAEGDPGNFYAFSSGADGNYVVIQRINSEGQNHKQHSFYKVGFRPQRLMNSSGVLYGVSNAGGANSGSGYIFKFTPTDDLRNFQVLFNFSSLNGRKPVGALVEGADDFLYGVTTTGGAHEGGVIYKIKKDGTGFTKIHDFDFSSGRYPLTGLVTGDDGWLYGRTSDGAYHGHGAIFKIRFDGTGYANIDSFGAGSKGDMAYHDGHLYVFHQYNGQPPAILKFNVNRGFSFFHVFPETSPALFEGHSILVDPNPKAAKVLTTSPANGATVASTEIRVEFSAVTNASSYSFEISRTADFSTIHLRGQSTEPHYTIPNLTANNTYYIRVKTNVWPTFGPTTSFNTNEVSATTSRISNPKDGAVNVSAPSTKVTAGLVSGANRYTIELSTSPAFSTKLVRTSKTDSQRTMIFDSLKYSTKYYGRFKTNVSSYSPVTSFTTAAETFPVMISPSDGMSDVSPLVVDLVVEPSRADAKRHTIQLSTSSQFIITVIELKSIEDFQTHHIVKNLRYATRYFVRIKSDLNENWSKTYSFRTRESIPAKEIWGVTTSGGTHQAGTVFSYDLASNQFTKRHDYDPITYDEEYTYYDYGEALQGSLIHGSEDKLYFHSSTKGSSAYGGSLFQVDRFNEVSHVEEIALHYGNMTLGSNNTIYTSVNSHLGAGVIDSYEIHSATWERLKIFVASHGVDPGSELVELHDGYLYGRATEGGVNNGGTLYRLRYDGSGFEITHVFPDGLSGKNPTGDLALANDGFFYGTTRSGGAYGHGTIFKVRPDGSGYSKIYDFTMASGSSPMGGVIANGNVLYGTTASGGAFGHGTIFSLYTSGNGFVKLHDFSSASGSTPLGRLTYHASMLYGMTSGGGTFDKGTVFQISRTGVGFTVLHHFDGISGAYPDGHLIVRENVRSQESLTQMAAEEEVLVSVSPNPSTTDFAVAPTTSTKGTVSITITDMNGFIMYESKLAMDETARIGEALPKGIYILKATVNGKSTLQRLVKK